MNITMYSTHCPQCNVLEKKLNSKGLNYIVVDDVDVMQERGFKSAPVLDVDGVVMNFKTAIEWIKNI